MAARIKVLETLTQQDTLAAFRADVLNGLSAATKRIPSRYFYDDAGSSIFQQIMDLPEYYPTDCEHEILKNNAAYISELMANDQPFRLIELGAGDGRKTRLLLDQFVFAPMFIPCFVGTHHPQTGSRQSALDDAHSYQTLSSTAS